MRSSPRHVGLLIPIALALLLVGGWRLLRSESPLPPALPRPLVRAQVRADLLLFQRLHETADAGFYKYRSRAQIDSAFAAARARVTDRLTVPDVYRLVAELTDFAGSLHNDTALPDPVSAALHAEAAFFPHPLKVVAGRLLLNTTHAPLPLGATILSINGRPAGQLVRVLGKYYTTDGLNTTGKTVGLASSFPEYYRLEYGRPAAFVVRYTTPDGPDTLVQTLAPVPYATYQRAFAARHSRPLDQDYFGEPATPYTLRLQPAQGRAVLTLATFSLGDDGTPGHRRYARFLDSCFTLLRRTPAITQLLVDIRANGGGDDNNDMRTFSYLATAPFRENRAATVRFRRVPYRRYLTTEKDTAERAGIVAAIDSLLRADFTPGPGGLLHGTARANPLFQPQPNRFRGQLYLLISPRVASAGSMFAAMVRGNTAAVVIGEETMGGYYGHTGHFSLEYTLPHSGIRATFSVVDLEQDVPARATQPNGWGVRPDYAVGQTLPDFLRNEDTQLQFTLSLMARQRRAASHPNSGRQPQRR